ALLAAERGALLARLGAGPYEPVRLVSHRPERRAVLRVTGTRGTLFVKALDPRRFAEALARETALAAAAVAVDDRARGRLVAPVAHDAAAAVLVHASAPGTSLHDLVLHREPLSLATIARAVAGWH